MQVDRKLGFLLLAVYLIVHGLTQVANLSFQYQNMVLGGLAIASGVVLILKR